MLSSDYKFLRSAKVPTNLWEELVRSSQVFDESSGTHYILRIYKHQRQSTRQIIKVWNIQLPDSETSIMDSIFTEVTRLFHEPLNYRDCRHAVAFTKGTYQNSVLADERWQVKSYDYEFFIKSSNKAKKFFGLF